MFLLHILSILDAPGSQSFYMIRVCVCIFLRFIISNNLRIAFIQIKLTVNFLLFQQKLAKVFFMFKWSVELLCIIGERLFHAFNFGLFIFHLAIKTPEDMFNAGDCSQSV